MNMTIIAGLATRDAEVKKSGDTVYAKYSIAINRPFKNKEEREAAKAAGKDTADFISCTAFGKLAEFAEKHIKKGTGWIVIGHLQTGSYTDKDGKKVYTTDLIVERQLFPPFQSGDGSKASDQTPPQQGAGFQQQGAIPQMPGAFQQAGGPIPVPTDMPSGAQVGFDSFVDNVINDPGLPWS